MKFATTALAIVFLAQAVPALAQREEIERQEPVETPRAERAYEAPVSAPPRGPSRDEGFRNDGPRGDRPRDDGEGRRTRDAPTPPNVADAPQAPAAPQARDGGGRRGGWVPGDSVGRPGPWTPNTGRGDGTREGGEARRDGPRSDGGGHRGDWDGRGDRDSWRGDGHRDRDHDRNDRRDWDRRDGDRRDWDRRDRNDRYSYWQRGRYPSVYFSSSRYRYAWRPPSGYYAYSWGFGDFLPRTWFGPGAWLIDPWRYDLPLPPPGFDWVRAGYDAVLVDTYSGRVVQVVRNVFW